MANDHEDGSQKEACNYYNNVFSRFEEAENLLDIPGQNKAGEISGQLSINLNKINKFLKCNNISFRELLISSFALCISRYTNSENIALSIAISKSTNTNTSVSSHTLKIIPTILQCENTSVVDYLKLCSKRINNTIKFSNYDYKSIARKYNINNEIVFSYSDDKISLNTKKLIINEKDTNIKLCFFVETKNKEIGFCIHHSLNLSDKFCASLASSFNKAIEEIISKENMSEIVLSTDLDRQYIDRLNNTSHKLKYNDYFEAFLESLLKYPNKNLVTYKNETYTYSDGAYIFSWIDKALTQEKISDTDCVGFFVQRSQWYCLAPLGISKHGAPFVALDTSLPDEQIIYILKDTKCSALLVTSSTEARAKKIIDKIIKSNLTKKGACRNTDIKLISLDDIEKPDRNQIKNNISSFKFCKKEKSDVAFYIYTSGTTGKPKGCMTTRLAATNFGQHNTNARLLSSEDVMGLYASIGFDVAMEGIFSILNTGACLDIVPEEARLDMHALNRHITKQKITHLSLPTQIGKVFISTIHNSHLKMLHIGGEMAGAISCKSHNYKIFDLYGPSEFLIYSSTIEIKRKIDSSSVGFNNANTKSYVLDKHNNLLPVGAVGRLFLSGYQISNGYLNKPTETSKVFLSNPFDGHIDGYEKMYDTGDIVRLLPDGSIGIIGRNDSQIKIRGNRIEPAEIEVCIRSLDYIKDVTVQVINTNTSKELCAYVVCNKEIKETELHNLVTTHVKENKPAYMIPAYVTKLESIPLNAHQKVDTHALPNPSANTRKNKYVKAQNKNQADLIEAFEKVLDVGKIGINDDFLKLGGDSLKAAKVMSLVNINGITAIDLMIKKTVNKITESINTDKISVDATKYDNEKLVPLSEQQLNIYLDVISKEKSDPYLITDFIWLDKNYEYSEAKKALDNLVANHPILKTRIKTVKGKVYLEEAKKLEVAHYINPSKNDISSFILKPFDINSNLSRFCIVNHGAKQYLCCVLHHLIIDGVSIDVLESEINRAFNNEELNFEKAYVQASAFSKQIKTTLKYEEANKFFDSQLCDMEEIQGLPKDVDGEFKHTKKELSVNFKKIERFAKKESISISCFFTSVFGYVLSRFSGSNKTFFNIIDNGRDRIKDGHLAIGMFVNTLPYIIDCKSDNINDFLKEAYENLYKTISFNFYPYRILSNEYEINSDIMFQYAPDESYSAGNKEVGSPEFQAIHKEIKKEQTYICQLDFRLIKKGNSIFVDIRNTDKFSPQTINRFIRSFECVANGIIDCKHFSEIDIVSDDDLSLMDKLNNTEKKLVFNDVLEALNHSVKQYPNRNLFVSEDRNFTYKQSFNIVKNIACKLKRNSVKPNDNVAIFISRSYWYYLCSIGVLLTGAAYVPIDDTYPDERISFMIEDTKSKIVIVDKTTKSRAENILLSHKKYAKMLNINDIKKGRIPDCECNAHQSNSDSIACILYTSGTTGTPKGSLITRGAINAFSHWLYDATNMKKNDINGLYASFGFDVHIEMYASLYVGASIAIIPPEDRLDPERLINFCSKLKISVAWFPISMTKLIKDMPLPKSLRILNTGGEAVGDTKLKSNVVLLDAYGPTENTVVSTWIDVEDKIDSSSIGYPLPNTKVYVLDSNLKKVPYGAIGQLYLSGKQLAKGYLNRPELNKNAFINNPFCDSAHYNKLYASGDMVRYLPDGTLAYFGRKDGQTKIRGNRIEIGEVESCIRQISIVKDVTVQVIQGLSAKELCAYVVCNKKLSDAEIYKIVTSHVSHNKPGYMVPSYVKQLKTIPLNVNGKVDKRKLPTPELTSLQVKYVTPQNKLQQKIIDAFQDALQICRIGIDDDFVRLGGDSLKAIQVISLLNDYSISASKILTLRTPRNISKNIHKKQSGILTEKNTLMSNEILLTAAQLNVYYDQMTKNKPAAYRVSFEIPVTQSQSVKHIHTVINKVIEAHPILSMKVSTKNNNVYFVRGKKPQIRTIKNKNELNYFISIDVHRGPLAYFAVCKETHCIKIYGLIHHLVFDGKSIEVFKNDFNRVLQGKELQTDTYFIENSNISIVSDSTKRKNINFFANLFKNNEIIKPVPIPSHTGGLTVRQINLDPNKISTYVKKNSITEMSFFCSVFAYTYSVFTNSDYAYFYFTDNGRENEKNNNAIGMFVKNIPVAINCTSKDISQFQKSVFEIAYTAKDSVTMPISEIAQHCTIPPLIIFQYFSDYLENNTVQKSIKDSKKIKYYELPDESIIADIDFYLSKLTDGFEIKVFHSKNYCNKFVDSFISTFCLVAKQMLKNNKLQEMSLLDQKTKNIYASLNNTEINHKFNTVLEALEYYKNTTPNAIAVVSGNKKYTYKEVDEISNDIAKQLDSKHVAKHDRVAIYIESNEKFFISALGVLKTGAVYVPINTEYPVKWIKNVFNYLDINAVITDENSTKNKFGNALAFSFSEFNRDARFINHATPDDAACIILTSGTTGKPKVVELRHNSIANLCQWHIKYLNYHKDSICGMYQNISFVSHLEPMFAPLFCGKVVDMIPKMYKSDMRKLNSYITQHNITVLKMGASVGRLFINEINKTNIEILELSGEFLGKINKQVNYKIVDGYGATEETAQSTMAFYNQKNYIESIGRPISNTKVYILDKHKRLLPQCAIGILYTSGIGTSNGYLNDDILTKNVFIKNPYINSQKYKKMYSTGDQARLLPDNTIGYLGRADTQVKIRGVRIELQEVESCIRAIDNVLDVTVQPVKYDNSDELCAYVVLKESLNKKKDEWCNIIRSHVSKSKPSFFVPTFIVILNKIPRNKHDKVDKAALLKYKLNSNDGNKILPSNNTEKAMYEHVMNVLKVDADNLGVETNLFNLGMNSLKAMQLSSLYSDSFGFYYPPADILINPTIKAQANIIGTHKKVNIIYDYNHDKKNKDIFFVHPGTGGAESYSKLNKYISDKYNLLCFEHLNALRKDSNIYDYRIFAEKYITYLLKSYPNDSYILGGWSFGAIVSYEMASRLTKMGKNIECIYMVDPLLDCFNTIDFEETRNACYTDKKYKEILTHFNTFYHTEYSFDKWVENFISMRKCQTEYKPPIYKGKVIIFKCTKCKESSYLMKYKKYDKCLDPRFNITNNYGKFAKNLNIVNLDVEHDNAMDEVPARYIAEWINNDLSRRHK